MPGVLESSRVLIPLVPQRLIAEAAREEGIDVEELGAKREGDSVVFENAAAAKAVFERALIDWLELIPLWQTLNFTMQLQEQTQWCWAATSVSISHYYLPSSGWTQCEMVNAELGQTTCCQNGSSSQCNQPNVLDSPLSRANVLDRMQNGPVGFDVISGEIDAGRPLAWRIGWSGGGGHFAVVDGYQISGDQWLAIDDPWWGQTDALLSTLTGGGYQGSGTWTHTYFTQSPFVTPPVVWDEFEFPWVIWARVAERVPAGGGGSP